MKPAGFICSLITLTASISAVAALDGFPGLRALIQASDAIVILRVERQLGPTSFGRGDYSLRDCFIQQTLKGDVPEGQTVRLQLTDTWTSPIALFTVGSAHLMFLTTTAEGSAHFRTLGFRGANIRLPDSACEKRAEGATIEDQVRSVIREAINTVDTGDGDQRTFLNMMLEGGVEPDNSIHGSEADDRRSGNGVQAPVAVRHPMPRYTKEARAARVEGEVVLQCIIGKNGHVTDCETRKGLGYGLDASAKQEIERKWRFRPGTRGGQPVDVSATIEIHFTPKMRE